MPKVSTSRAKSSASSAAITIRMYRVGFGDCFLVTLPVVGGSAYILVDCGVHARGDIGSLKEVVANIAAVTGRKLAVVIATHAHQDHIAGFNKFADEFKKFQIGEVWLPWTWDPANPTAVKLQAKHAALTAALAAHLTALSSPSRAAVDAVANLSGNATAIALLKSGFGVGATVRYVKAGNTIADPAAIKGLSVRVLGPPDSEEFLAQMDPPAGQHYLRAAGSNGGDQSRVEPFGSRWRAPQAAIADAELLLSPEDERLVEQATDTPAEDLAFALDKARNNESVVTLLAYRGRNLLFAGDAQYGNWRWWLDNAHPEDILPQVSFFKVAHHGSVNATPKQALEAMTDGQFAAMVSTQSTPWASIPRVPLMARLSEKTQKHTVRSDWLPVKGAPSPALKTAPTQPATLPAGFAKGALWFDYTLSV